MSYQRMHLNIFIIILLVIAGVVLFYPALRQSAETSVMTKLMSGFNEETVQMRFMSYATKVAPLKRMELAKLNQLEIFERKSERHLIWQQLNLPDVVIRATVPVEYRYYIDLNSDWTIEFKENVMKIHAPSLQPGNPAPDVSELKFEVRKGSVFRNEQRVAHALQSEITNLLQKRAEESTGLVRETARQQIVTLAQQWLKSESKEAQIVVQFADEKSSRP